MQRVGKDPMEIPKGVTMKIDGRTVSVKGPKGEQSFIAPQGISISMDEGSFQVARDNNSRHLKACHGMTFRLIRNMILGVTEGFKKELEIQGVGYKAALAGKNLKLDLAFSHDIVFEPPKGITIQVPKPTHIVIEGIDKQQVGQVAANIRSYRPPEPYKGKGIRYLGEQIIRKEGKTGK